MATIPELLDGHVTLEVECLDRTSMRPCKEKMTNHAENVLACVAPPDSARMEDSWELPFPPLAKM
jgi:hypothetical protein